MHTNTQTTDRLQNVLHLRHDLRWSLQQIGKSMGMSRSGVANLLARSGHHYRPVLKPPPPTLIRRWVKPMSLSSVHEV